MVVSFLLIVFMLNKSFLVTLVLLALTFVIGGRYWRDVINGVIVKFENRIAEGDYLTNADYSGIIVELGIRGIQIRLKGGDIAFISYRNLSDFKVRKLERDSKNELCSVTVKVKPEVSVESAIKTLRKHAMLIPYTLLTQPAKVEVVELDDEAVTLRALIYTQSSESAKLVELALNNSLKEEGILILKA
jgi:small-conductance mechanosensitive channel